MHTPSTLLALLLLAPTSAAQLVQPTSQARTVTVDCAAADTTSAPVDGDTASAPGFGPFDETVSAAVETDGGDTATCGASQTSSIGPTSVQATGSASAIATLSGGLSATASGVSSFLVTFDLSLPSTYELDGFVSANSGSTGLTLTGPGGPVETASVGDQVLLIDREGTLDPGQYTLEIEGAASAASFGSSGAAYNVLLALVGEPASFCDAADGSLGACPCLNPGAPDTGCEIQQGTGGVGLELVAQQSTPANRVTWRGSGFPTGGTPTSIVIRAGTLDAGAPVVFGDGLRCVGTPLVRLGAAFAIGGTSTHTHGHGAAAGTGDFYYQLWFRNTPSMFCTPAAFNLSSGRALLW